MVKRFVKSRIEESLHDLKVFETNINFYYLQWYNENDWVSSQGLYFILGLLWFKSEIINVYFLQTALQYKLVLRAKMPPYPFYGSIDQIGIGAASV